MRSLLIAVLLLSCFAPDARACACRAETAGQQAARADIVFTGTVISLEQVERRWTRYPSELSDGGIVDQEAGLKYRPRIAVTFLVNGLWKGAPEERVVVTTDVMSSCGFRFELGRTYVVFAYEFASGAIDDVAPWTTGECTGTAADGDFTALGPPLRDFQKERFARISAELDVREEYVERMAKE